ncbi:ATP-grasp domain-containing protein [Blautia massiliensis (ex Durand et al. 2017)]|uniref:ATP-grasp domain-containing protein n=1 Tax=Blautia massiliensis (ex Durand et al. 2017) TaxID=1737424 RepID=UPI00241E7993|nr:ATP-grasp domain-containing protein [Blautia massiliensis (ex Durand et al. 2017)]MBN2956446.1 ATP-grasp domain-containing protein [Blautia massiliensis (ex Durand et al. 2017)]
MKKILLLGGSAQQIVAIKTAQKLGYYTVLCDYLPDNPGQYEADKFYLVSTTDKEAVLKVALDECVDGVLAYASDPAAPTAAYVAEKMKLLTNPYESVMTLCNKDCFRSFLKNNGFNTPVARGYSNNEVDTTLFSLPVIIKPVDSSGSKGATVLHSWDGLNEALEFAFSFSRSHRIIVEEFIEKKHPYLIGGDIFVNEGKVILWGLLNCHRDNNVNPLVPVGKSYPLLLDDVDEKVVQDTLQSMVDKLGIRFGSVNVELVVDKNNKVWPIDIGPRAGGNMIPDLLGMIFGVDVVEMAVLVAMGEKIEEKINKGIPFYATHNLHTSQNGKYKTIEFSDELENKIIKKCLYKKAGDEVYYFDNAAKALGIIFMKFKSQEEMTRILANINKYYSVVVE